MSSFRIQDILAIDAVLRDAALTQIMPRFRRAGTQVRAKSGPLDLVTDADIEAERVITRALHAMFPHCVVAGEEAVAGNPALLAGLAGADLAFVVDPVDGTANFAAGLPLFGVMAAAIVNGEVAASVIHDPLSGGSAIALRGEGAWEQAEDGTRADLRVASAVPVAEMTGAVSWRYLPPELRRIVLPNLARPAQIWDFRCAAHQYRMLAAGHCHFMMFHKLMPWDHLPGWLLHREAGGYAAHFDGTAYRPGKIDGGLICAPDRNSFEQLRTALLT